MVSALLVGVGMLLISLLTYGVVTALLIHWVVRLLRRDHPGAKVWKNVGVIIIISLVTALVHLIEIALWAVAFLMCEVTTSFDDAFYISAQNYTALGYGDYVFAKTWRLLGPLEAVNGLLLFGLSTAVMFAVLNRLITNRLRHQHDHRSDGQESPAGKPSGD